MFERFTDRVRRVMAMANQEAGRYNYEFIGTEHILLALSKGERGGAAAILKYLDVDVPKLCLDVEEVVRAGGGADMVNMGKLPQTPGARKVIENAITEARSLDLGYVGTEHALLGLMSTSDEVASQILTGVGLNIDEVREAAKKLSSRDVKPELNMGNLSRSPDTFHMFYPINCPTRLHIQRNDEAMSTISIPKGYMLAIQAKKDKNTVSKSQKIFRGDLVVRINKPAPGQQDGACHELMADSPFELTLKDSVVRVEEMI